MTSSTEGAADMQEIASGAQATPTLWAIAGGKGGVGKSLVTTSLAISFARRGHRCALIDLDLGAANAHSLFGMAPPLRNLTHFIEKDVAHLSEILVPTPFENLHLAGGARASLDLANPRYSQKEKLLRHITQLEFDHVFLDLSAGCTFNVLDFFLAASQRIAVLIPEKTAIENTQHFLKAAFFRSLRDVAKAEPLRSAIREALVDREAPVQSARDLLRRVEQIDATAGRVLARSAAAFAPSLVVNQVSPTSRGANSAREIALACRHFLAASVRERGQLPRDERVREAVAEGTHVLQRFPGSKFSKAIDRLVRDLLQDTPPVTLPRVPDREEIRTRRELLPPLNGDRPGPYLRSCRERLGLSLAEVCQRTRIRNLESIEDERFEELPSEIYVIAFVRQYARALGVADIERLTARYVESFRSARPPVY